jgi:hypothetical protein
MPPSRIRKFNDEPWNLFHSILVLAYVVNEVCVLWYDNEAGKGDHRHWGTKESEYRFSTPEKLLADFQRDIEWWSQENGDS